MTPVLPRIEQHVLEGISDDYTHVVLAVTTGDHHRLSLSLTTAVLPADQRANNLSFAYALRELSEALIEYCRSGVKLEPDV